MLVEIKDIYLPLIMAIFLGYIAFQQMRINRDRLKLDLYNKRFEVYSRTLDFHHALVNNELTTDIHRNFIEAKQSSKFLFHPSDKIYDVLKEMHIKSFKVTGFREHAEKLKGTNEYTKAFDEMHDSINWIISQVEVLDEKISKYLNFHK